MFLRYETSDLKYVAFKEKTLALETNAKSQVELRDMTNLRNSKR